MTSPQAGSNAQTSSPASPSLPKLSPSEFKGYNQMAERMDLFHNYFRQNWNIIYSACAANRRPAGMSIRQFLSTGINFCHSLDGHHSMEETYFFPMLARKMPEFRRQEHLLEQHKEIHKGLDRFQEYLERCRDGEQELRLNELKEIMDGFGEVLWEHLDDEVATLGAENMRKYWTLQEINAMMARH